MNKIELLKNAATFLASAGVGLIVKNAVSATTPVDIGRMGQLSVNFGTFVVSTIIASKASKEFGDKIETAGNVIVNGTALVSQVKAVIKETKDNYAEAKTEIVDEDPLMSKEDHERLTMIDPSDVSPEEVASIVANVSQKVGESKNSYQRRVGAEFNQVNEQKAKK